MQDDRALIAPGVGDGEFVLLVLVEQVGATDLDDGSADGGFDADCRGGGEVRGCGHVEFSGAGGCDDGASERVFTVGLGCGSQRQHLVFGSVACGVDGGDGGLALGQGAGLVEQHRVHGAHGLQREAVLDEHPAAGGALGRDRHHQRDRESERVGAGDDEHGDRADHGSVRQSDQ